MKSSIISITALHLALIFTNCPAPAWAAESANPVVLQAEFFDVQEQARRGIAAYHRGDYQEAFRLLSSASAVGGAEVHYRLGVMYAEGLGIPKNPNRASYWLKQAAKQNHPGAMEALAALKQPG